MTKSTHDKGIRIPVILCDSNLQPLQVPGLIAIPGDRLERLEELAVLAKACAAAYHDLQRNPTSTAFHGILLKMAGGVAHLSELWDF